jgi:hypothetical protein
MTLSAAAMLEVRATVRQLITENMRLRRKNSLLRDAILHQCAICRIAWCAEREHLAREALGREWPSLRVRDE